MLKPISRKELVRKLKRVGFSGPFSGAKHQYMLKNKLKIFIPNPHGKDIGLKIIKRVIVDISISDKDFYEL